MAEITTSLTGETPEMQAERLALLDAGKDLINSSENQPLPLQAVAAESGLQTQAGNLAESGIGVYQPYLEQAGYTMGDAQKALMDSTAGLANTTQMYDPNSAQAFFNPYENAAGSTSFDGYTTSRRYTTGATRFAGRGYWCVWRSPSRYTGV